MTDDLAEGVKGAVTGTDGKHVTHMLYADDLALTANDPNALQTMLNRLDFYAWKKHLTINTAKSEVVQLTPWDSISLYFWLVECHWPIRSPSNTSACGSTSILARLRLPSMLLAVSWHLPTRFGNLCASMH
eukprot:1151837-Pelagomonas_calceolata.AAC.4